MWWDRELMWYDREMMERDVIESWCDRDFMWWEREFMEYDRDFMWWERELMCCDREMMCMNSLSHQLSIASNQLSITSHELSMCYQYASCHETATSILIPLLSLIAHLFLFLSLTSYVASCRVIESWGCLVIISIWKDSAGIFPISTYCSCLTYIRRRRLVIGWSWREWWSLCHCGPS